MSTWASRLSSAKPVPSATAARALAGAPRPASTTATAGDAAALRAEFRVVAETYNEQSVCLLRLPPDCWELVAQYLPYTDVVALGHACRVLWAVLHARESVWRSQLAYFHEDVRGLRSGKLLCTAPLFPEQSTARDGSRARSAAAASAGVDDTERSPPPPPQFRLSAYERFFQERRLYVLDSHREWHFQELADVADKSTGMFTVALHDGRADPATVAVMVASPVSAEPLALPDSWSTSTPPVLRAPSAVASPILANALDGTREWLLAAPSSPASPVPTATPPHRRTISAQTSGTSAGNSPAIAPVVAPSTPPLLPRVGEPIINDRNPPLRLRVYAIESERAGGGSGGDAQQRVAGASGGYAARRHSGTAPTAHTAASLAGMTEEQMLEYAMRLSLADAPPSSAAAAAATTAPAPPDPASVEDAVAPPGPHSERQRKQHYRCHRRGASPASSLPLSELVAVLDALNNNAHDQLQHYHVRDFTADEDPAFLQRLSETLRGAKHRRLHLGNHHRAVRNNGQTTRNRAGRSTDAPSSSWTGVNTGGGGATPPQGPPPMNRMLRGFHGDLLEITEREAQLVVGTLLDMPRVIDDFVVFKCYDPALLYRVLNPPYTVAAAARDTTGSSAASATPSSASPLTPLPFFTRFFIAPELCHGGHIAVIAVDVVRVLVVVGQEVMSRDHPDWASPLIARGGRVVVHGQGYNAQAYTRDDYNYVPPNPTRRRRDSDLGG
ncbi:hypothetical protein NESM_000635300 [Novymonas esmeraldas]|uniref:F-box domain-containing protein n=1 Tax=Novymonas esmeraldas TaxID=1808958 RepID=A0AAW0ERU3_9TRYP